MPTTASYTLEDLDKAARATEQAFTKHSKYGAVDTEPRANARDAIRKSVKDGKIRLPNGTNHWELYDDRSGWQVVEAYIDEKMCNMLNILLSMRLAEINEAKRLMTKYFYIDWD